MVDVPPHPLATIRLGALRRNIRALRNMLPSETSLAAVVKADAYGHGVAEVSRVALEVGCPFLIVATVDEALCVRRTHPRADVLIVGPIFEQEAEEVVAHDFACCVGNTHAAEALVRVADRLGRRARVHLKIDTGMGRFGFLTNGDEMPPDLEVVLKLPLLKIEGVATHFSEADDPDSSFTEEQLERFRLLISDLQRRGVRPSVLHAANSGGIVHFPASDMSMARGGLSLYGPPPGPPPETGWTLEPVMTLTCRIADVRYVPTGTPVSYGRTFVTERPSRLALLPVGYAHGYPRSASGRGEAIIRGCRAPVVGRVTMNLTVVDVTDAPDAKTGDPVLLFGRAEAGTLPVEELAAAADTIPYEILCRVGAATPRVFVED